MENGQSRRRGGAFSRSPRGGLQRLSPGVYRNQQGQLTGAGGRPLRGMNRGMDSGRAPSMRPDLTRQIQTFMDSAQQTPPTNYEQFMPPQAQTPMPQDAQAMQDMSQQFTQFGPMPQDPMAIQNAMMGYQLPQQAGIPLQRDPMAVQNAMNQFQTRQPLPMPEQQQQQQGFNIMRQKFGA